MNEIGLIVVCISDGCEFSSTDVCISEVDSDIYLYILNTTYPPRSQLKYLEIETNFVWIFLQP